MTLLYFKALHLIFVVTWFAALFYIVRLFIYQTEANQKEEPDRTILTNQLKLMSKRLWYFIGWPSAILTLIFGLGIIHPHFGQLWLYIKLGLLAGLYVYHHMVHFKFKKLQKDIYEDTPFKLRLFNEGATLFLFSIMFVAVLRDTMNILWGILVLAGLAVVLVFGIKLYKKSKPAKDENKSE